MTYKHNILLLPLLAIVFVGKSANAIKCYQCFECADAGNLPEAKECTEITIVDAAIRSIEKVTGMEIPKAAIKTQMDKVAASMKVGPDDKPESCFKQQLTHNDEELVYRGCGPHSPTECETMVNGQGMCFCDTDDCNSAPTAIIPSLFAVCLSIILAIMYS